MKRSSLWLCALGIAFWTGAMALAQGQTPERGAAAGQVRDRVAQAGGGPNKAPAADANAMAKVKAAREDANAMKAVREQKGKAVEEVKAKGQGMERQVQNLQKQMQEARAKHMERVAKLNRLRELANKQGNKEMLARIDKLMSQENQLFGRKESKAEGQSRAVTTGPNDAAGRKGQAGKDAKSEIKSDAKKDVKTPEAKPEKK
jgi:hypothetical protein